MKTLIGNHIYLRALEPEDLEFLYGMENNESVWEVSNTTSPYSKFILTQYLENSYKDIYEAKQLRLVISSNENETLGLIDIFDLFNTLQYTKDKDKIYSLKSHIFPYYDHINLFLYKL